MNEQKVMVSLAKPSDRFLYLTSSFLCIDKVRVTISKASSLCLFCFFTPRGLPDGPFPSFLLFCATNQTQSTAASTHTPKLNAKSNFVAFLNLGGSLNIHVERTSPKVDHDRSKPDGSGAFVVRTFLMFHVPTAEADVNAPVVCKKIEPWRTEVLVEVRKRMYPTIATIPEKKRL